MQADRNPSGGEPAEVQVLSVEETTRVILATTADGSERVGDDEVERTVRWANWVRAGHLLLEAVLSGQARPRWPDPSADGPSFAVRQRGPGADDPDGRSTG